MSRLSPGGCAAQRAGGDVPRRRHARRDKFAAARALSPTAAITLGDTTRSTVAETRRSSSTGPAGPRRLERGSTVAVSLNSVTGAASCSPTWPGGATRSTRSGTFPPDLVRSVRSLLRNHQRQRCGRQAQVGAGKCDVVQDMGPAGASATAPTKNRTRPRRGRDSQRRQAHQPDHQPDGPGQLCRPQRRQPRTRNTRPRPSSPARTGRE